GAPRRVPLGAFPAGLKAVATWHATDTIQACREACGGAGYLKGNRLAALKADTDVFTTFEGDNTVLLQLCAKNLLTDERDRFVQLDALGTAQVVAGQAIGVVAEGTAARYLVARLPDGLIPGRDHERALRDRVTQLELLRWRQQHILAGLGRR